jgi:glycosyltransferase involved in cell wall biosynthesis
MAASMRVVLGDAATYGDPARVASHAFARAFLDDGARLCWIGTPLDAAALIRPRDEQTRHRIRVWQRGGERPEERALEYYPLTLLPVADRPGLRTRFVVRHTLRATLPRMEAVIRRLGFHEPDVLWLSTSRFAHALFPLRARVRACRVSDDWAHHGRVPPSLITAHDAMVDAADLVFATSRGLKQGLLKRRPDAIYLPNGVDERFFAKPGPEPDLLSRFPRPRVVVVGRLDAWVDFETIARVGERIPHASVLVIGPGQPESRSYPANVHFTGPFPYGDLPALLAACDVGLVPFLRTPLTHAVSPLKLFEYLASGLPVVATRLDEIEATSPPALLCDTPDAFAGAVASVLDGDPAGRTARVAFAREHTWTKRFGVVRDALAARGVA